jgi:hypothetical protein
MHKIWKVFKKTYTLFRICLTCDNTIISDTLYGSVSIFGTDIKKKLRNTMKGRG